MTNNRLWKKLLRKLLYGAGLWTRHVPCFACNILTISCQKRLHFVYYWHIILKFLHIHIYFFDNLYRNIKLLCTSIIENLHFQSNDNKIRNWITVSVITEHSCVKRFCCFGFHLKLHILRFFTINLFSKIIFGFSDNFCIRYCTRNKARPQLIVKPVRSNIFFSKLIECKSLELKVLKWIWNNWNPFKKKNVLFIYA